MFSCFNIKTYIVNSLYIFYTKNIKDIIADTFENNVCKKI